jgi:hypothetical protein
MILHQQPKDKTCQLPRTLLEFLSIPPIPRLLSLLGKRDADMMG